MMKVLALLGTFLFAMEGASTAVQHELDLFGLMVLVFGLNLRMRPAVA